MVIDYFLSTAGDNHTLKMFASYIIEMLISIPRGSSLSTKQLSDLEKSIIKSADSTNPSEVLTTARLPLVLTKEKFL